MSTSTTTTSPPLATTDAELAIGTKSLKTTSTKKSTSSFAKSPKKRPSDDVWVMGYVISNEDFLSFISSLRDPEAIEKRGPLGLLDSMVYYDTFKRSLPKNLVRYVPALEEIYKSQQLMHADVELEEAVSHMFFPLRYIPYKSKNQLLDSHPDSKIIREESVKDKARMTRWVEYLFQAHKYSHQQRELAASRREDEPSKDMVVIAARSRRLGMKRSRRGEVGKRERGERGEEAMIWRWR